MKTYYRRQSPVDAEQLTSDNIWDLADRCGGAVARNEHGKPLWLMVPTLHGTVRADYGDWVCNYSDSEDYWPVTDAVFAENYTDRYPATEDELFDAKMYAKKVSEGLRPYTFGYCVLPFLVVAACALVAGEDVVAIFAAAFAAMCAILWWLETSQRNLWRSLAGIGPGDE